MTREPRTFTRERTFWFGLLLRVAFLPYFGSSYLRDLFIPFIDFALKHPFANPWRTFPSYYFPYGSVLFVLEFIPKWVGFHLVHDWALGEHALSFALMKLPLLVLDVALLFTLFHFSRRNLKKVIFYYWLNPVLFFITYIHGQLDVASIAFVAVAAWFLVQESIWIAGLCFAAGVLCKFHVIAVFPLFIAYLWHSNFLKAALQKCFQFLTCTGLSIGIGFIPQLQSHSLDYVTVNSPQALRMLATRIEFSQSEVLYIGMCFVLLVILRLCLSDRVSKLGLILGSGLIFGSLLVVTNPMPGWYFWAVPFIGLFFATFAQAPKVLYWALQGSYFLYFVVARRFFAEDSLIVGFSLSVLQTTLLGLLVFIYHCIANCEIPLKQRLKQLKIGIAGDSGSGKNHLTHVLQDLFGERESLILEGDNYHRWERHSKNWEHFTHLSPQANNLNTLSLHATDLGRGQSVWSAIYDHQAGVFQNERELSPNRTLFVQGLHALYPRSLRANYDLKIFLDPDESLRTIWKIGRDVTQRGHDPQAVLKSIERRAEDSLRYVRPQADFADWIIRYQMRSDEKFASLKLGLELEQVHSIWNDVEIDRLANELADLKIGEVRVEVDRGRIDRNRFFCRMKPSSENVAEIARRLFPNLRELTRSRIEPVWHDGYDGISQLVALTILDSRLKYASNN